MRRRDSIARQLPLFVCGLLAPVLVAMAAFAWVDLGRFAVDTAGQRLLERAQGWADLFRQSIPQRLTNLRKAAALPELEAALVTTDPAAREEARAALRRAAINSTLALELRDEGERLVVTTAVEGPEFPSVAPELRGFGALSRLADGRIFYDIRVEGGSETGLKWSLVERHRVAADQRSRRWIAGLMGPTGSLLLGNASGDVWTDFSAPVAAPPAEVLGAGRSGSFEYLRDGEKRIGALAFIPDTPWVVGVEQPRAEVFGPVNASTARLAAIAAGLLLIGAAGAWLLSRRFTTPLRELSEAVASVAGGALDRRVCATRRDEFGRLGLAFNAMADRVVEARQTLERRVEDRTHEIHVALAKVEAANGALRREIAEKESAEAEVGKLNHELSRQLEELAAVNAELESFSYSVSHDLRAPLRALAGFSAILLDEHAAHLNDDARHCAEVIQRNARRMGTLIDDLLAFSRVARQSLNHERIDLESLVRDVWEELENERAGRRVELRCGPLPACTGDRRLLRQALVNLLSNALKYTRPREIAVIEVGRRDQDGEGGVYVKDNGVGFDMRYADKLFKVFQRLHPAEEFEGTGVGLALTHRILHRHGFRIQATAAPGQGATFHFTVGSPS